MYQGRIMIKKTEKLKLPEGLFEVEVYKFYKNDKIIFQKIYKHWRNLDKLLNGVGSRAVNLPEGLSEGSFCLAMDSVRIAENINGANSSWDCYNLQTQKRIQIKACSVTPALTSFGPNSEWDVLYFLDFYRKGHWDGTFDIYKIENNLINIIQVNNSQTFSHQQSQGRRLHFSIYKKIIKQQSLSPIKTYNLSS